MSQPDDDRQLGKILVSTAKPSREEDMACLGAQQLAGGSATTPLGQVAVTPREGGNTCAWAWFKQLHQEAYDRRSCVAAFGQLETLREVLYRHEHQFIPYTEPEPSK